MPSFDSEAFLNGLQDAIERTSGSRGFSCPICTGSEWTIVDGVFSEELQNDEPSTVHAAPVVCDNCAFVARFVIGQD